MIINQIDATRPHTPSLLLHSRAVEPSHMQLNLLPYPETIHTAHCLVCVPYKISPIKYARLCSVKRHGTRGFVDLMAIELRVSP